MTTASSDKMNGFPGIKQGDIVISGISGRFPESDDVEEFKQQLLDGVNMITGDPRRWPSGLYGLPDRFGKLKNLSHFDAQYFGVHAKQADEMDPQLRILLEVTHEAIMDAGYNPMVLRGSKCGVFIGVSSSESLEYWELNTDEINGYGLTGCSRSMLANRISYSFDFKGPSLSVDSACSSSLYALSQAIRSIQSGDCDSAIVGGGNLLLKPETFLHFHRLGMMSLEGACKAFDDSGKGYVRSDTVAAIFLQKADVARRVYASVLGIKTNSDGYKEMGITFPSGQMQFQLLQEVYAESGVHPTEVKYIEAHGTGTKAGDPQEVNAIAEFFCKNREGPLLIGSVKSNMGHSEGASALCAIVKVIISMETGIIPANLHYKNPKPDIPSLSDGRLKVVSENQPWEGGILAVNSFGFGGANAHIILQSNPKPKIKAQGNNIPRLVRVSGRTEEAVRELLEASEKNKDDEEFLSLLEQIHQIPITGHGFKGYTVLDDTNTTEIKQVLPDKRPIWFVYSGMGSQWPRMGKDMMKIKPFRKSIKKIAEVLKPRGYDIEELIVDGTDETFENITNAYIAITAIQIALTDLLTMLKIEPDGLVGHSFGEVGCAYADGLLTAEQAILCTLERGEAVMKSNSPSGAMASVGLSWEEAEKRCPPSVYPACHNSKNNVTIAGDKHELQKFITTLASEGVFVREVKCAGYAFHCPHIEKVAPILQESLKEVIPHPKPRSSRWISTSVLRSNWNTPEAQLCSVEYFINNLLAPVYFQEGISLIPKNALVIEIAPTGLFLGILKKSIGPDCEIVSLASKNHKDNVNFFLASIGKMYAAGAQPNLESLYGSPKFPVGRGTPMISPHIKWDHSTEWSVPSFIDEQQKSGHFVVKVDLTKDENKFLFGHKIDGRLVYPAAGYLILVWKSFARVMIKEYKNMPVILENIRFHRVTLMSEEDTVKFIVNIFTTTGAFELCEGGTLVASGKIRVPENIDEETVDMSKLQSFENETDLPLTKKDIYKELFLRGHEYSDNFKGIMKSENGASMGEIFWNDNWICFIDTLFQFTIIDKDTRDLYSPIRLQKLIIDPLEQMKALKSSNDGILQVKYDKHMGVIKCGGVEGRGLKASITQKRSNNRHPKLEKYQFIPYHLPERYGENNKLGKTEILTILAQIVIENFSSPKVTINEIILDDPLESSLSPMLKTILEKEPTIKVEATLVTFKPVDETFLEEHNIKHSETMRQNVTLAVCHSMIAKNDLKTLKNISSSISHEGFILLEEPISNPESSFLTNIGLQIVCSQCTKEQTYLLLRKISQVQQDYVIINVSYKNFSWVQSVKDAMVKYENQETRIYLYSDEKLNGILGMVNVLRKEPGGKYIRSISIQEKLSTPFSFDNHSDQFKKDLVHNVFKGGVWGCYRHLLLKNTGQTNDKLVSHAIINTLSRGDLSSLRWIEGPLAKHNSGSLCYVYYASLNFRDVMLATGKLPPEALPRHLVGQENILGLEYAGRDSSGKRLMGLVESKSLATTVLIDPQFCWEVPDKWSLGEASTIPVAYCTAYYSLVIRGQLQPGESVLIHAGSGGVGIASISVALHMGCQVFTTVGSQTKRDFLKKTFPELSDKNIGYSRDTSFEQFILSETLGRGVDVVLNSLAGHQLEASVRCLADDGRFLELGKIDLANNSPLGMNVFLKNISFHGILVDNFFLPKLSGVKKQLVELINEGVRNGAVRPLPLTVFNEDQLEEAFRYMAAGKHIGKVVIKIRDEEPQKQVLPKSKMVTAISRAYMNPKKSYIIVGGLGGFGLELTNWLINRGATKIFLSSRTGVRTGYQSFCMRKWRQKGIKVIISLEDVTTEIGARRLIEHAKCLGPVGGIFNLAVVLKDGFMNKQTEETFRMCCRPKIDVTFYLDKVSRETVQKLDYFVTFSSLSGGRGNIGQSNYAFANSVMEQILEDRHRSGFPALVIQWGAVGDVGLAMELLGTNDAELAGTSPQRIASCLETMDILLEQSDPIVTSFVLAENRESRYNEKKVRLVDAIGNILGLKETSRWPPNTTLSELGLDSLMVAEIKQTLELNFEIILNPAEIRNLTFNKLTEYESNLISERDLNSESTSRNYQPFAKKNIEIMPRDTIVKMSRHEGNGSTTPIFMIHPIEGNVDSLFDIVQHINAPVYGLQCTVDAPLDSIENLAEFYLKHMRALQPTGPYRVVGYSFGACLCFELGVQLEKFGQEVQLWFIDGSPQYVSIHLERERAEKAFDGNIHAEQSEYLVYFMSLFRDVDQQKILAELKQLSSWDQRLSKSMKILAELTSISENQLTLAASGFFQRKQAAGRYRPSTKFHGRICLIKATDNDPTLSADYGLSEICLEKVKIHSVEGNHTSILRGSAAERIARIVQSPL